MAKRYGRWDNPETSDTVVHAHVAEDGFKATEKLDELEGKVAKALKPMTDEEKAKAEAEKAKAAELAKQHGTEYHGFGHPPAKDE